MYNNKAPSGQCSLSSGAAASAAAAAASAAASASRRSRSFSFMLSSIRLSSSGLSRTDRPADGGT